VATKLDTLKGELLADLQIHTNVVVIDIKSMLASVQQEVSVMSAVMSLVFQKLPSSEERELSIFADIRGGVDNILANDTLLSDLFAMARSTTERPGEDAQNPIAKESPSALREEIKKDPDDLIRADATTFENKFNAFRDQVVDQVEHNGNRIILEIQKGPHQRILNWVRVSQHGLNRDFDSLLGHVLHLEGDGTRKDAIEARSR
jgi:hypothetical protein